MKEKLKTETESIRELGFEVKKENERIIVHDGFGTGVARMERQIKYWKAWSPRTGETISKGKTQFNTLLEIYSYLLEEDKNENIPTKNDRD